MRRITFCMPAGYNSCKLLSKALSSPLRARHVYKAESYTRIEFDARPPLWGVVLSTYERAAGADSDLVTVSFKVGVLSANAARSALLAWAMNTKGGPEKYMQDLAWLKSVGIPTSPAVELGPSGGELTTDLDLHPDACIQLQCDAPSQDAF